MDRDNSISVIRVTAMMMIVLYHCLCYNAGTWEMGLRIEYSPLLTAIVRNIATVGLTAFVFISGLLYYRIEEMGRYNDSRKFIIGKVKRLLIPYLVWGLVICLVFYGEQRPVNLLYGISHLWFLLMLFEIFLITTITRRLWKTFGVIADMLVFLGLIIASAAVNKNISILTSDDGHVFLSLQFTFSYLPAFYFGMLIEKYRKNFIKAISSFLAIPLIVILFCVGVAPAYATLRGELLWSWIPTYALLAVAYQWLSVTVKPNIGWGGQLLDRFSLAIYIIHHIFIVAALNYVPCVRLFLDDNIYLGPLLMFVIVMPLSLAISYAISYLPGAKYIIGVSKK